MSAPQGNAPRSADTSGSKSPGKGGKSLQIMQQRLQSTQEAPPAAAPQVVTAPPTVTTQQPQQPPQHQGSSPSSRKGKDFAAMSARAPVARAPSVTTQPTGGKPKGKDFSAMTPDPNARAAQMQASARAAAGMPPLEQRAPRPTTAPPTASEASLAATSAPHMAPLVGESIQTLLTSIDPNFVLDVPAQEQLVSLADDFLDKVVRQSLRMCSHRGSKTMDVGDIQAVLDKQWNITIPNLGPPVRNNKRPAPATASTSAKQVKPNAPVVPPVEDSTKL